MISFSDSPVLQLIDEGQYKKAKHILLVFADELRIRDASDGKAERLTELANAIGRRSEGRSEDLVRDACALRERIDKASRSFLSNRAWFILLLQHIDERTLFPITKMEALHPMKQLLQNIFHEESSDYLFSQLTNDLATYIDFVEHLSTTKSFLTQMCMIQPGQEVYFQSSRRSLMCEKGERIAHMKKSLENTTCLTVRYKSFHAASLMEIYEISEMKKEIESLLRGL